MWMWGRSPGRPRDGYHGKWIVYNPESYLWIGECESFVHAFYVRNRRPDPQNWLIGRSTEHQLAIKGVGRWLKLQEPEQFGRKRGDGKYYRRYRGPR